MGVLWHRDIQQQWPDILQHTQTEETESWCVSHQNGGQVIAPSWKYSCGGLLWSERHWGVQDWRRCRGRFRSVSYLFLVLSLCCQLRFEAVIICLLASLEVPSPMGLSLLQHKSSVKFNLGALGLAKIWGLDDCNQSSCGKNVWLGIFCSLFIWEKTAERYSFVFFKTDKKLFSLKLMVEDVPPCSQPPVCWCQAHQKLP